MNNLLCEIIINKISFISLKFSVLIFLTKSGEPSYERYKDESRQN